MARLQEKFIRVHTWLRNGNAPVETFGMDGPMGPEGGSSTMQETGAATLVVTETGIAKNEEQDPRSHYTLLVRDQGFIVYG